MRSLSIGFILLYMMSYEALDDDLGRTISCTGVHDTAVVLHSCIEAMRGALV
jgi:hypothetical protein